jgi:hypothetical protein
MKRTTKTERLQRIVHEYNRRYPGPFTMESVVDWALERGLLPAPGRLKSEAAEADEWDRRFSQICAEEFPAATEPAGA